MDNIMAAYGHTALRLPLYHPDLNPTELVWADVKQSVGAENGSFHFDDVAKKCEKWFSEFGIENWGKVCDRTEKNEKECIEKEAIRENTIEKLSSDVLKTAVTATPVMIQLNSVKTVTCLEWNC